MFRRNSRTVIFHLEPGAIRLRSAADFDPAIAITGGVDHHIRHRAFDRQRVHFHFNAAGVKRGFNFPLIATFGSNHLTEYCIKIRHFHRHLLPGAQVVDKLLNDGVALFDIFIDRFCQIAILLAHHLSRQANTRQRRAQVVTYPRHQQRAVIRQLLNTSRHMVKGTGNGTHLGRAILTQRRRNNPFTNLQGCVFEIDQRSVLDTNKQPRPAYRQ